MAILNVSTRPPVNQSRNGWSWIWFVMSTLLFFGGLDLRAQTAISKEYQVKALFLYNFSQFVEWPAEAFAEAQSPLVIGVLGEDPFGAYLDEIVRGEKVNNHPLVVQRYHQVEEIKTCHILFISQSEAKRLEQIFTPLERPEHSHRGRRREFCPAWRNDPIRHGKKQNPVSSQPGDRESR